MFWLGHRLDPFDREARIDQGSDHGKMTTFLIADFDFFADARKGGFGDDRGDSAIVIRPGDGQILPIGVEAKLVARLEARPAERKWRQRVSGTSEGSISSTTGINCDNS